MVQFLELWQMYRWRHTIIFEKYQDYAAPLLILGMIISLMVAAGLFTRWSLIVNFVVFNCIHWIIEDHYHIDNVLNNVAFIFLLAPKPKSLAVDAWLGGRRGDPRALVPGWFVVWIVIAMSLLYLDSVIYKINSELWTKGLAFWMPAAIPHFSLHRLPDWMEIAWLLKAPAYIAFSLETLFPLILFKRVRIAIIFVGMSLHVGIVTFLPIPLFGMTMVALYLMFLPIERLLPRRSSKDQIEDSATPDPVFMGKLVGGLGVTMFFCQVLLIIAPYLPWNQFLAGVFGLSRHPVFVDWHFRLQSPILRFETTIDGQTVHLPSFDEKGYPDNKGRMWVYHNFIMRNDRRTIESLDQNLMDYLKGWFYQQNMDPIPIRVFYKDVRLRMEMDFDQDEQIEKQPWHFAGEVSFSEDHEPQFNWTPEFEARRRDAGARIQEYRF